MGGNTESETVFEVIVGYTSLFAGGLTLFASVFTLIFIYMRKTFKFIRNMTWVMVVTSVIQMTQGAIILSYISPEHLQSITPLLEFIMLGVSLCAYDVGMNSIIWFVTFKYWETARQFSRMVRVLNNEPEDNGKPAFPHISRDS